MEKDSNRSIYDLVVIGNGIAAQSFLWNLSIGESKSQTFSIAHIYSEKLAPACSIRSSATVSLNGIEEDVSPLGNDMREAFFLFDKMFKDHRPDGVEVVTRTVVSTNENDTKKLTRRYKVLKEISSPKLKNTYPGAEYDSYIITPEVFSKWLDQKITVKKDNIVMFVKDMEKKGDHYHLTLEDKTVIVAKKVLFATGAFSKIFEKFLAPIDSESIESKNMIKAGSYLERSIDLGPKSFYFSIDGHQVLYRKNNFEQKLIIGSATTVGPYESPDLVMLSTIFNKLKNLLAIEIGDIQDFKVVTGLRHKGPKRMIQAHAIDESKTLFRINGLYKNGYTMSFLASQRMLKMMST